MTWDYVVFYGSAVSMWFLFVFNNYCKNNMKCSCLDYCKQNCKWGLFRTYAVNKRRCLAITSRLKCQLSKPKLHDNILFIKDGIERENVRTHENTHLIKSIIERNDFDLVLYRTPSKHAGIEYNIIRLCESDINSILTLQNDEDFEFDYSESDCTIINPVLQINTNNEENKENVVAETTVEEDTIDADPDESKTNGDDTSTSTSTSISTSKENNKNDNSEIETTEEDQKSVCSESSSDSSTHREVYELMLERDNYLIVGNKIFDFPFIKWLLKEQHKKIIEDDQEYNIYCFDGNINQYSIDKTECLMIEDKNIQSKSTVVQEEKVEEDEENDEHKKVIEKANSWSYFLW